MHEDWSLPTQTTTDDSMADCNQTLQELDAFLDGEISVAAATGIHNHLESCVDCLQTFEFHAELKK